MCGVPFSLSPWRVLSLQQGLDLFSSGRALGRLLGHFLEETRTSHAVENYWRVPGFTTACLPRQGLGGQGATTVREEIGPSPPGGAAMAGAGERPPRGAARGERAVAMVPANPPSHCRKAPLSPRQGPGAGSPRDTAGSGWWPPFFFL